MTNPAGTENLAFLMMLVATVIGGFGFWRLLRWVRELPVVADPWPPEIGREIEMPEAVEICLKCATPQPPGQWFCEHCGNAVGDYNNLMPFVYVFSQGEVLRNGVTERMRGNALIIGGYLLLSLACYSVFAPIYWYFLFGNLRRPGEAPKSGAGGSMPPVES